MTRTLIFGSGGTDVRLALALVLLLLPAAASAYTWQERTTPTGGKVTEMVEGEWRVVPYDPNSDRRYILIQDNSVRRGWFKTEAEARAEAEKHQKRIEQGLERHP